MFSMGVAIVAWRNKKQPTVALSSTEADYRGATVATCEVIWLRLLLQYLWIKVPTQIPIYSDPINIMQLAKNPVFHARKKHIEVLSVEIHHFVRERVLSGEIELRWFEAIGRLPTSSPRSSDWTSCNSFPRRSSFNISMCRT